MLNQIERAARRLQIHGAKALANSSSANLAQVRGTSQRLLHHLGLKEIDAAADGPESEIGDVLGSSGEASGDEILEATASLGCGVDIRKAVEVARLFERLANVAIPDVEALSLHTFTKGHVGEDALDNWVGDMMVLYQKISGRLAGRSVGAVDRPNEGKADGPMIRFLQASGKSLALDYSAEAWGSRIKRAQKRAKRSKT